MDKLHQANKDGVVLGLKEVAGVHPRLDIDVLLLNHPDVFNLLLIALMELKSDPVPWSIDDGYKFTKDDKTSFFQLAGIHGLPWAAWDGENVGKNPGRVGSPGYCAHGTPTFGPWHRPYVAMFEQTLYRQIANIAERFSRSTKITSQQKQKYKEAAKSFRLPYWDYYRPREGTIKFPGVKDGEGGTNAPYNYRAPWIFTEPQIMVKTLPDDELKAMDNPFLQWNFERGGLSDDEWNASRVQTDISGIKEHTIRYSGLDATAIQKLNDNLNKIREDEMRQSLVMIESDEYSDYNNFSTDGVMVELPDPKHPGQILKQPAGSIEDLHGNYHVFIGGYTGSFEDPKFGAGHMSRVPVAAFDPVFWIHHCQIDRLFAIWQAVNPKHWFEELRPKKVKEKVIPPPKGSDPLVPFRKFPLNTDPKSKERYWTSDLARNIADFGYSYPDLIDKKDANQIRDDFAANYGWSRRLQPYQPFGKPTKDMLPLPLLEAQAFKGLPNPVLAIPRPVISHRAAAQVPLSVKPTEVQMDNKVSYEWYIDNVVERMAMNGAFTIFYIIGEVSGASGADWSRLPGFVGVNHIFTAPREACDNCGRQEEQATLVTGTSPITSLLLDYVENGSLESMAADHVAPFLVKNLKWRAQVIGGNVINPRVLANEHSFRLSISCKTSPLPGQTGQVTYDTYPEIIQQIVANAS